MPCALCALHRQSAAAAAGGAAEMRAKLLVGGVNAAMPHRVADVRGEMISKIAAVCKACHAVSDQHYTTQR